MSIEQVLEFHNNFCFKFMFDSCVGRSIGGVLEREREGGRRMRMWIKPKISTAKKYPSNELLQLSIIPPGRGQAASFHEPMGFGPLLGERRAKWRETG